MRLGDDQLKVRDIEARWYSKSEAVCCCQEVLRQLLDGDDFDGEHLQVNRS